MAVQSWAQIEEQNSWTGCVKKTNTFIILQIEAWNEKGPSTVGLGRGHIHFKPQFAIWRKCFFCGGGGRGLSVIKGGWGSECLTALRLMCPKDLSVVCPPHRFIRPGGYISEFIEGGGLSQGRAVFISQLKTFEISIYNQFSQRESSNLQK